MVVGFSIWANHMEKVGRESLGKKTSCECLRGIWEAGSRWHLHYLVWSSREGLEGQCVKDVGGKAKGERGLSPRGGRGRQREEKAQDRALGGDSFKGGSGRSGGTKKRPVGAAIREAGGGLGMCLRSQEGPCFKRERSDQKHGTMLRNTVRDVGRVGAQNNNRDAASDLGGVLSGS